MWSCVLSIEFAVRYIEKIDFQLIQMNTDSFGIILSNEIDNIIKSDVKDDYLKEKWLDYFNEVFACYKKCVKKRLEIALIILTMLKTAEKWIKW